MMSTKQLELAQSSSLFITSELPQYAAAPQQRLDREVSRTLEHNGFDRRLVDNVLSVTRDPYMCVHIMTVSDHFLSSPQFPELMIDMAKIGSLRPLVSKISRCYYFRRRFYDFFRLAVAVNHPHDKLQVMRKVLAQNSIFNDY